MLLRGVASPRTYMDMGQGTVEMVVEMVVVAAVVE